MRELRRQRKNNEAKKLAFGSEIGVEVGMGDRGGVQINLVI